MRIKDLEREQMFAEIIAERDGMILEMNGIIGEKEKEIEALKQENEKLKHINEELSSKIPAPKKEKKEA
ncbi:MAG: hypothetical protein KAI14_05940 [Dehalococcoidales bacterium]|nr:hypothetical protein [Dehalococcoidales bacterium]